MNTCGHHACVGGCADPDAVLSAELRRLVLERDRMPDGLVERVQASIRTVDPMPG